MFAKSAIVGFGTLRVNTCNDIQRSNMTLSFVNRGKVSGSVQGLRLSCRVLIPPLEIKVTLFSEW